MVGHFNYKSLKTTALAHHLCKQPCFPEEFSVTSEPCFHVIYSPATQTASPLADPAAASWSSGSLCGHGCYCKFQQNTHICWVHQILWSKAIILISAAKNYSYSFCRCERIVVWQTAGRGKKIRWRGHKIKITIFTKWKQWSSFRWSSSPAMAFSPAENHEIKLSISFINQVPGVPAKEHNLSNTQENVLYIISILYRRRRRRRRKRKRFQEVQRSTFWKQAESDLCPKPQLGPTEWQ